MAYICSSGKRALPAAVRSSAEAAAVACAAALPMWRLLDRALFGPAVGGLACAWAVSSASTAALAAAKGAGARAFWWAFGGGMALRAGVFVALLAFAWDAPWRHQAASWSAYALGVLLFLQLEYRRIVGF